MIEITMGIESWSKLPIDMRVSEVFHSKCVLA